MRYVFGAYTLDPDRYELCRGGEVMPLQPQVFKVLTYLVQHRDRVLSKQELLDHLWPETAVSEAAVERCIRLARHALGDGPEGMRVIQTLHRRGYRFVALVTERASEAPRAPSAHPPAMLPSAPRAPADPSPPPTDLESLRLITATPSDATTRLLPALGRCAGCGCENPASVQVCVECGMPLMNRCPGCGAENGLWAQCCGACGIALAGRSSSLSPRPRSPHPQTPLSSTPVHLAEKILTARSALSLTTPTPPMPVQTAPPRAQQPAQATPGGSRSTGQRPPEAEWRQLTVLVCRLVGVVSERARRLDPEELLEVVRDYHALGAEVVQRFDGHIAQYQGDRLVVYFGYPQAHEDDAHRAVHTGLGLVERMAELHRRRPRAGGVQLAVRVGIHTGVVVVGAVGQDEHAPLALGETPTLAAQVQDLAAPGTVVIGPTTLRLVEGYFGYRALGAYMLEEPTEPPAIYQILPEDRARSRFEVRVAKGLTPLVGREQEMALLRARWAQVQNGWGQVILLSGEPGIGKSRLVQEFKQHLAAEAYTPIACHASSYHQQSAFYPVLEHVQRLLRFRQAETPEKRLRKLEAVLGSYDFALEEVVPLFAGLLSLPLAERYTPLTLTPERQKQKTLEALLRWLLRETERQPVCLLLEDLHWVDPSTLEWLSLLMDQIPTTRVLLLLTFRPDFQPPWAVRSHLTHLTLGRLSPRQTEGMIRQVVGGKPLPAEVMHQVMATTDGVPLFVEELTKMVLESGLVKEREERYALTGPLSALAIPATLHDSLMARLDRLDSAKQIAQVGAVLGREFAYEVLRAVSLVDEPTLRHALARLVEAELLYQRGLPPQATYAFKHALIQEAAYQSLLKSTRQQYHQHIMQVLLAQFPEITEMQPELLAHHAFWGEMWDTAVAYFRQAGAKAMARSAYREAVVCLEQALVALAHLPDSRTRLEQDIDLRCDLRNALLPLGEQAHIYDHLRQAVSLAEALGDQRRLGQLAGYMSVYLRERGNRDEALTAAQRQLAIGTALGDVGLQVAANSFLGELFLWIFNDYRQAVEAFRRNIETLHGALLHERFGTATVHAVVDRAQAARCLAELGAFAEGRAYGEDALRLAAIVGHPYSLVWACEGMGNFYLRQGALSQAIRVFERGLGLPGTVHFPFVIRHCTAGLGVAYALSGRVSEALPLLEQALEQALFSGPRGLESLFPVWLGEGYVLAGRLAEAMPLGQQALEVTRTWKQQGNQAYALRLLGEIAAQREPPEIALGEDYYHQALALAEAIGMRPLQTHCHRGLGILYAKTGQVEQARAELWTAITMYQSMEMTFWLPEAEAALAQVDAC